MITNSISSMFIAHVWAYCPHVALNIQAEYMTFLVNYRGVDDINTLNEFWRYKSGMLTINTIEILSNIRDSDKLNMVEWLQMFNDNLLPYMNVFYPITK